MSQTEISPTAILELLYEAYALRGVDLKKSISIAQEALAHSKAIKNASLIGQSLTKLALFHLVNTEHQLSIDLSLEAIEYFELDGDELGIANAKYNIAGVHYKTNNFHLGMFHLIDCLIIYLKYDDKHNQSKTHKSLGTIYELLGDQTSAVQSYEAAIQCAKDIGDKNLESNAYNPLSGILLKLNQPDEAMDMIEKSIRLKQETNDTRGYAFAIYGRGKVHYYLKQYAQAESDYNEALAIHKNVGDSYGIAMTYNKLCHLYVDTGRRKKAIKRLKKNIKFTERVHISVIKYKCYYFLYNLYRTEHKNGKALSYLEKYLSEKDTAVNSQTLKVIENYERILKMQSLEKEASLERERKEILEQQAKTEQKAAVKQEFLSAMSHEIRTPLNAVTSIISLLQERSDENERKLLTSLRFSAKNLLRIINDILDFSKLDSNKMRLEKHPANFRELLENIKLTYASLAQEKGISLDVQVDQAIAESYTLDETKIFQILGNLVSNAIKFTEKGSVTIQVSLKKQSPTKDTLSFKVIDSGIGIEEKEKAKLFESFYMPQFIMTRSDGGTGLGLAIVKKLVNLHDSRIFIDSTLGTGSTFYFDLELEKSEVPLDITPNKQEQLRGKTAILAEDNEINALVMRQLLSKWGVQMQRAKTGHEAVALARQTKVDFILMDIHMPEMDGFEATQHIRGLENLNRSTPIFALTADVTALHKEENATLFNGFLWKPVQIERLFEALTSAQPFTSEFIQID